MGRGCRVISDETKFNIIRAYRTGVPCADISKKYGVGINYACVLARRQGIKTRNKYFQEWEKQAIADAFAAGEKTEVIAVEFGIHITHIRDIARKFGLPPRSIGHPKPALPTRRRVRNGRKNTRSKASKGQENRAGRLERDLAAA